MNTNAVALVFVGLYLLAVGVSGHSKEVTREILHEGNFVKWALAVIIVYWLYQTGVMGEAGNYFVAILIIATLMVLNEKGQLGVFRQFQEFIKLK